MSTRWTSIFVGRGGSLCAGSSSQASERRATRMLLVLAALLFFVPVLRAGDPQVVLSDAGASVTLKPSHALATQLRRVSQRMVLFVVTRPSMEVIPESEVDRTGAVRFIIDVMRPGAVTKAEELVRITETSPTPSQPGRPWRSGVRDGRIVFADPVSRHLTREVAVFKAADGEWVDAAMPLMRSRLVVAQRRYARNLGVQYEYSLDLHLSPEEADSFALAVLRKHLRGVERLVLEEEEMNRRFRFKSPERRLA